MKIRVLLAIAGASFIVVSLIIAEVVFIIDLATATPDTYSLWFWLLCIMVGIPFCHILSVAGLDGIV